MRIIKTLILSTVITILGCGGRSNSKSIRRDSANAVNAVSIPDDPTQVSFALDTATIPAGIDTKLTFQLKAKNSETNFRYKGILKLISSDTDDRVEISKDNTIDFIFDGKTDAPEISYDVTLIKAGTTKLTLVDSYSHSFVFPVTVTNQRLAGFNLLGIPKKINRKARTGIVLYLVDEFQNTVSNFEGKINLSSKFPLAKDLNSLSFDPKQDGGTKKIDFVPLTEGSLVINIREPITGISKEITIDVEDSISDSQMNSHHFIFSTSQKAFACLPDAAVKSQLPVRLVALDSGKIIAEASSLLDLAFYDKDSTCLVFKDQFRNLLSWGDNHFGIYFLNSKTWDIAISYEFNISRIDQTTFFPISNLVYVSPQTSKSISSFNWNPPYFSKVISYGPSAPAP